MSDYARLLEEWGDLLERRPTFRAPLAPYGDILEAWARWSADAIVPLAWSRDECRARWQRGLPLLAEMSPAIPTRTMEDLVGAALDFLAAVGTDPELLGGVAAAWDRGDLAPAGLLPCKGRLGSVSVQETLKLSQEGLGFLAVASLRPPLDAYFAQCRPHVADGAWNLSVCPLCGAPPGFADLTEDGRCRLACHVCASAWIFSRMCCPFCGNRRANDLVRLAPEDPAEEGYAVEACKQCSGYVKAVDRRLRWNAGSALIEDWGSPHLDLIARRSGYWRPIPSIVELAGAA